MSKFYYCECCGQILDRADVRKITVTNRTTKKRVVNFNLCEKDAERVKRIKLDPMRKVTFRKNPDFYNVKITNCKDNSSKTIFAMPSWNLWQITKFCLPIEKLKLKGIGGKHYWTVREVKEALATDDKFLCECVELLYKYQTEDEKKARKTVHDNAVGFNQPDASFLSGMARLSECKGYKKFTKDQIAATRKAMTKYCTQVTLLLNR